jgi:hypothetical protein
MPMKSKLQNEDELLLRYILNELDPSEETIVEKAMLEDENVLIEVESLRTTLKKTSILPLLDPPADITSLIVDKAIEFRAERAKIRPITYLKKFSYAAAATILIAGGSVWYVQTSQSNVLMVSENPDVYTTTTSGQNSSPWIDKQNILHIGSIGSAAELVPDSVMNKLRPIDGDQPLLQAPRHVQLTGTQK